MVTDLSRINQLINRMKRAGDEIKKIVPDFKWSYELNFKANFESKPESLASTTKK